MTQPEQYEKEEKTDVINEKADEKRQEKQYEKMEEKSLTEKTRHDPVGGTIRALILIWAGVVFLLTNLGILVRIPLLAGMDGWSLAFTGAGVLVLFAILIRALVPEYRRHFLGSSILAMFLLSAGLGPTFKIIVIWAIGLIVIGTIILFGGFLL